MRHEVVLHSEKRFQSGDGFQIIAISLGCLTSFSGGMLFSWTSPSVPKLVNDKQTYDITLDQASYLPVIQMLAIALSSIVTSSILDLIGRKYMLWSVSIPYIISWCLIAATSSIYAFYVAKVINGIGDALMFTSLPVYIGEISSPKIRGTWGNMFAFTLYLGNLVMNSVGSYTSVPVAAGICLVFPVIFACTFIFMSESPYYCLMRDRPDDARKSLRRLRGTQDVENELQMLQKAVKRQMSECASWKDLVMVTTHRKALVAGIFLRSGQHLGGISCFLVYTQYIFARSGSNLSASTSSIIFVALTSGLNFAATFTMDRFGRKKSFLVSAVASSVVLFLLTAYFWVDEFQPDVDTTGWNWIPLAGMATYVLTYSFGQGIVPLIMLGELFSASVKAKSLCVMNIVFALVVGLTVKLFLVLDTEIGLYSPFLFFALASLTSGILSIFLIPETKGKTLDEIQRSWKTTGDVTAKADSG